MNRISILDCTLRDGGYVNNFEFGEQAIREIASKLSSASIDIIECGFLKSGYDDRNLSLFGGVETIKEVIRPKNHNSLYVAMIQYGGIDIEEINEYDSNSIDGIRITFHEHEIEGALVLGAKLMAKGYKVFMQPVGTSTYSDSCLLALIDSINELSPYAFYIVDTHGTMYKNDLMRLFYLFDNNLNKDIAVGFHSHNNLQLSFANAQELMQLNSPRKIIIDASVYGMGRGAGNLNTELVTQFLNANFDYNYDNIEIIGIIDEFLKPIARKYKWGYDIAYFIASVTGSHPNYASFLLNKQTLLTKDIYAILNSLQKDRKVLYDKKYINDMYLEYMDKHVDDSLVLDKLKSIISGRKVLLLAPGKSVKNNYNLINEYILKEECFVISVNFEPKGFDVDMMFISNMKRFDGFGEIIPNNNTITVVTSNIINENKQDVFVVDYYSCTNKEQCIIDNSGLMAINLMKRIGISEIILAGFDGFVPHSEDNFYESSLYFDVERERLEKINAAMKKEFEQLKDEIDVIFLTNSLYKD